jgi:hypothetical protein
VSNDMVMYQGDLKPDLRLVVTDQVAPGSPWLPVDLSAATSVVVRGRRSGSQTFEHSATGDADGVVVMEWQAGDTAETGTTQIDVRVIWPGNKPQTFRAVGNVVIRDA